MKTSVLLVAATAALAQATGWQYNTTLTTTTKTYTQTDECSTTVEYPTHPPVSMPTVIPTGTGGPLPPPGNGTVIPPPGSTNPGDEPTNTPIPPPNNPTGTEPGTEPTGTEEPGTVPTGAAAGNKANAAFVAAAGFAGLFLI